MMKNISLILIIAIYLSGCKEKAGEADAYGNFEATEVIVSAETSGRILHFDATEGNAIVEGTEIALIDTLLLHLQKGEIEAGIRSIRTRMNSIDAQNGIVNQQIGNLKVNISRVENMLKDDAATQKQYDDLKGQEAVYLKQIEAGLAQRASTASEIAVLESKKAVINEQIRRSSVKSPISGTLIEKYSEAGEITSAGRPLAKIADLSTMRLKVYVSGSQIGDVKLGKKCTVRIDKGKKDYVSFPGVISFISGKAEFTPKIIQTKEERVTLVYAVNITVANDGSLKSGMPGEALFNIQNE
jgi:HlyD family secretion protein